MTTISVAVSFVAVALRTVPRGSSRFLSAVNSEKDKHSVTGSQQTHHEALKMSIRKAAALPPVLGKSRVVGRGERMGIRDLPFEVPAPSGHVLWRKEAGPRTGEGHPWVSAMLVAVGDVGLLSCLSAKQTQCGM